MLNSGLRIPVFIPLIATFWGSCSTRMLHIHPSAPKKPIFFNLWFLNQCLHLPNAFGKPDNKKITNPKVFSLRRRNPPRFFIKSLSNGFNLVSLKDSGTFLLRGRGVSCPARPLRWTGYHILMGHCDLRNLLLFLFS